MSQKLFGGVLALLAVGWLVLFFVLVWPVIGDADEQRRQVDSKVSEFERYARAPLIVTEAVLNAKKAEVEALSRAVDAALDVVNARDQEFESFLGGEARPEAGAWKALYQDEFSKLEGDYRTFAKLPDEERLPFAPLKIPSTPDQDTLFVLQKEWRTQETLVRALMKHAGRVESCTMKGSDTRQPAPGKPGAPVEKAPVRFSTDRRIGQATILLPASSVVGLFADLCSDPALHFEIVSFELTKQITELKMQEFDKIESTLVADEAARRELLSKLDEEPHVRVEVGFEIVDWTDLRGVKP